MNRYSDLDTSFKRLPPVCGYHREKLVSLEQSLESIQSEIDDLPRYVKLAKRYCHYPSEHNLSRDQSASIYIYTMEWDERSLYRVLNNALRSENRQEIKIWFPYLRLFESALDLLPTVRGNLWRGFNVDVSKAFTKNQLITWWTINSCSASIDIIKNFFGNNPNATFFLIEAMNGKRISGYTAFENEDEVILPIGTQLCVKSNALNHPNGSCFVHLVEIDEQTSEPASKPVSSHSITLNTKWKPNGTTIAGGNDRGNQLNQLSLPFGMCIDDDHQCIYIADCYNHRIIQWEFGASHGEIFAGGNGEGNHIDQLNYPTDVILNPNNDSIIIADQENRRIIECSRKNKTNRKIILSNIDCSRLTLDHHGDLYISDHVKHEVRRWRNGEGILVAGGNGEGKRLNQLSLPTSLAVDEDESIYISDNNNHRIIKWIQGAKEGKIVAGGEGKGNSLSQLSHPQGLILDHQGNIYIGDSRNQRILRWSKDSKEVSVLIGGHVEGQGPNQFNRLGGIAFDREGNLFVVDNRNNRVQKFHIIK